MMRTIALAALLVASTPARAEPADEAAKSYRIDTAGSTQQLAPGKAGKLVVAVVPVASASAAKVHVDPRAPFKVALEAAPGLKLEKTALTKADATEVEGGGRRVEAAFTAEKPGKHELRAKLDFFVCSDTWCVKQTRDVTVSVDVK